MRKIAYYNCEPHKNLGPKAKTLLPDHPISINIREDALLQQVCEFMSQRLFGADRRELLARDAALMAKRSTVSRREEIESLRRSLQELEDRQARQILALERSDDPDGAVLRRITERVRELETQRLAVSAALAEAEEHEPLEDPVGDIELLDALPVSDVQLMDLPEPMLRNLFEAVRLAIRYNKLTNSG